MKITAYGVTPEELALQDAAIAGAKAGQHGSGASLNPFDHDSTEYRVWDDARLQAIAQSLAGSVC